MSEWHPDPLLLICDRNVAITSRNIKSFIYQDGRDVLSVKILTGFLFLFLQEYIS